MGCGLGRGAWSIPACTGKPTRRSSTSRRRAVYPRMYGETVAPMSKSQICDGLSPHVRGNPMTMLKFTFRLRSIPACTGKPDA